MADIISLQCHKSRKAADRGFREWRRLFRSVTDIDEHTKWADLPDEIVLFFCEEDPESKHALYDLLMGAQRLGTGHDLEAQAFDTFSTLMNAYFFITDQARFECMRRLGWIEAIPRGDRSIIDLVMDSATYEYAAQLEAPVPASTHPAYEEDRQSRGIDRPALVRKYIAQAIRLFKERVPLESSATQ
ncbi:MAG TPA: hypothetical protein PLM79_01530 [Syntrophobacteraceae bacterium]|nr:hypothetical protein [Syntrophobacteraceae bacterium]